MAGHLPMERFEQNANAALANPTQKKALRAAAELFAGRRRGVLADNPDWQRWRERCRPGGKTARARRFGST